MHLVKLFMNRIAAFLFLLLPFLSAGQTGIAALSKVFAPKPFLPESRIQPVNGSAINYTQIMFDHPAVEKAVYYQLSVYEQSDKDSVLVFSGKDSTTATLVTGLQFGKAYSWQYAACNKRGKKIFRSPRFTFSILPLPRQVRVRVIKNDTSKIFPGLISFDYAQIFTDRNGTPVWFMPTASDREFVLDDQVRDLRVTSVGTITFITEKNAYETAIDGRLFWKGPVKVWSAADNLEHFHHGFRRMENGHLLAMGTHTEMKAVPGDTAHIRTVFGVIGEYDRQGRLLWKWDSQTYFQDADLFANKTADGKPDFATHMNACALGDSGRYAYAGFRDKNRIVKIDRLSGKVVASYGDRMPSGNALYGDGFFRKQHDISLLRDGSLAVFNNDTNGRPSSVVVFSQVTKPGEESRILFYFPCDFDTLTKGKGEKGGNVDEMPNGNLLVNMGSLNRSIEITRNKEVVWDAFVEYWLPDKQTWQSFNQYRSHYAESLYPCYFTSIYSGKTKTTASVTIFNEGTGTDSYTVEYKLADGAWFIATTTDPLLPGEHILVSIDRPGAVGMVFTEMRIRSVKNPDFIRLLFVK